MSDETRDKILGMTPAEHIEQAADTMSGDIDPRYAERMWLAASTHLLMALAKQATGYHMPRGFVPPNRLPR